MGHLPEGQSGGTPKPSFKVLSKKSTIHELVQVQTVCNIMVLVLVKTHVTILMSQRVTNDMVPLQASVGFKPSMCPELSQTPLLELGWSPHLQHLLLICWPLISLKAPAGTSWKYCVWLVHTAIACCTCLPPLQTVSMRSSSTLQDVHVVLGLILKLRSINNTDYRKRRCKIWDGVLLKYVRHS